MLIDSLSHGWLGLFTAYASVQGPMLLAMARGRASPGKYARAPAAAAALTAVTGMGLGVAAPILSSAGLGLPWIVGAAVCAAAGYAAGRVMARPAASDRLHLRGAVIEAAESARGNPPGQGRNGGAERDLDRAGNAAGRIVPPDAESGIRRESRDARITLAGKEVPPSDEAKHFKMIGTTGTGKSTAICELLGGAFTRGDRAVIADPDGGYLRRFYSQRRGDLILNPFERRSVRWDLFGEIESDHDVDQLARALIPDHEGQDRSWRGYARTFFTAVAKQAHAAGVRDVGELFRLLVVAKTEELRVLVEGTPAQPFLDEHNARMFDSIRSVTTSAVAALEFVARQTAEKLSIRRWVAGERNGVLFIPYKAGEIAALGGSVSAWMRLAIFETMNRDEAQSRSEGKNRRLWFVVDELDALGPIDGLKDALARLRKFDGRCILGFQSIAQVSTTYGHGGAHTIVENCGNTLLLRCSASEGGGTARFASNLIGDREVLRTSTSTSRRYGEWVGSKTRSQHIAVETAVMPSEIEQLPDLDGYLKFASDMSWRRVRLNPSAARTKAPDSASTRTSTTTPETPPTRSAQNTSSRTPARTDGGWGHD